MGCVGGGVRGRVIRGDGRGVWEVLIESVILKTRKCLM